MKRMAVMLVTVVGGLIGTAGRADDVTLVFNVPVRTR